MEHFRLVVCFNNKECTAIFCFGKCPISFADNNDDAFMTPALVVVVAVTAVIGNTRRIQQVIKDGIRKLIVQVVMIAVVVVVEVEGVVRCRKEYNRMSTGSICLNRNIHMVHVTDGWIDGWSAVLL